MVSYEGVVSKFSEYHKSDGNVWAHLLTTSLGLLGVACVLQRSVITVFMMGRKAAVPRAVSMAVWIVYAVSVSRDVPWLVGRPTICVLTTVAMAAAKLDWGFVKGFIAIAAGYLLQDIAHWYYGEETYQQNSWGSGGLSFDAVFDLWLEHCYYLLPLTLACARSEARILASLVPILFLSWSNYALDSDSSWGLLVLAAKKRLLIGKLGTEKAPDEAKDMNIVRDWVMRQKPVTDQTSHWWVENMDNEAQLAFERLVQAKTIKALFAQKFHCSEYTVEPVRGMNEIYVSVPSKRVGPKTSDDVFFTEHVDGPFCFFPFASVYRCILALDQNKCEFTTHFPNAHNSLAAKDGDILAFDFHRESHYITQMNENSNQKHRVVLKLHYVAAPTSLFWLFGRLLRFLSVKYNQLFRALFLATIKPTHKSTEILADLGVVGFTVLYNALEKFIGYANLTYYLALTTLSFMTNSYALFLYSTQFLHYCRYIATYYDRTNVAFGTFKRDVLLFKSIALVQLLYLYAFAGDHFPHPLSTFGVALGYFISVAATQALGVDGTYFGIELNVVKKDYRFVTKFPYNVIPHPMILGQCLAIASMHLGSTFLRTEYPLLCPIHIILYLTHLTQEAFDFHDGIPWYKQQHQSKDTIQENNFSASTAKKRN